MIELWFLVAVLALIVVGFIVSYNRFVKQRQMIKDAFSNIDTELRRRYDLIPNLIETVKGYAAHERETFQRVTEARASAINAQGPAAQAQAENILSQALKSLFAVAENYPTLKANENFLALQAELSNTEDRIQTSRRFYNSNVRGYNQRVHQFPSAVIASMFHFADEEYFEVDEAIREAGAPKVDFSTPAGTPASSGPGAPQAGAPPPAAPPSPPETPSAATPEQPQS